jgi:hypothetical protein
MSLSTLPAGESSIDMISLMGEADKANNDAKKDVRQARKSAHLERMGALDENIDSMQDQKDKMKGNSVFNFVMGMVSNMMNIAAQVISTVFPVLAPIVTLINSAVQAVMKSVSQYVNGDAAADQKQCEIDQQKFQKIAEESQNRYGMEDEFYKSFEQSGNTIDQRLEASLQNMMKAQDAAVRA